MKLMKIWWYFLPDCSVLEMLDILFAIETRWNDCLTFDTLETKEIWCKEGQRGWEGIGRGRGLGGVRGGIAWIQSGFFPLPGMTGNTTGHSASCIWSSDKLFRNHEFFSEKIIVGLQEGEIPPPLAQMVLTQCISISELLVYHRAPPGGQI